MSESARKTRKGGGASAHLFLSSESQYLASSSGDLLDDCAILVTALLLMKRPHALSSAATKPASLLKADMTKALYFLCTSSVVCTYTLGSWTQRRTEQRRRERGRSPRGGPTCAVVR